MARKPLIFVCDDDEDDKLLVRTAFEEACIDAEFSFASDGEELTEYLENSNECKSARCPDIILLDINMPRMDGPQTLEWIKSRSQFRSIPVVMYTTSNSRKDIDHCYLKGANSFMTKCSTFEHLVEKVEAFAKYWTGVVELPRIAGCKS